jgi:hypothetical protein
MEVREWIEQCLDDLQTQKDAIEAELEVYPHPHMTYMYPPPHMTYTQKDAIEAELEVIRSKQERESCLLVLN